MKRAILRPVGFVAVVLVLFSEPVGAVEEPVAAKANVSSLAARPVESSPWQRIVMIGASATAGFIASEPFGGTNTPWYALNRYVNAALTVSHDPVQNFASAFFFLKPQQFGQQQITRALTNNPTLIIGLDFPFWFCYGEGKTDEDRLQRFEQGLKLLESIQCPLVLGDLPDASAAVNKMLRPDQMPTLTAIASANQRLKAWAAGRSQVVVVELSTFMRQATTNRSITVSGHTLADGQTRMLLQSDALHPTPLGCAVLALAVLDAVPATRPSGSAREFLTDPEEIHRRVSQSSKPEPGNPPITPK